MSLELIEPHLRRSYGFFDHRQIKCFYDLTDFHSRCFNAVMAQVLFVLLSYTLRQWQLWTMAQEALAGRLEKGFLTPLQNLPPP
jgi:hypothetical protein